MAESNLSFSSPFNKICSIEWCSHKLYTKGFCRGHYDRYVCGRDMNAPFPVKGLFPQCTQVDCSHKHYAKGLCKTHYDAARPYTPKPPRPTLAERLWAKVDKNGPNGCWLWMGKAKSKGGYGSIGYKGSRAILTHRAAWFVTYGVWPKANILHSCDVRNCVNPQHLREGDHQANSDDKVSRNRQAKGSGHGQSRLLESDVLVVDALAARGVPLPEIAAKYGVSTTAIRYIVQRKNWKHIPKVVELPAISRELVR